MIVVRIYGTQKCDFCHLHSRSVARYHRFGRHWQGSWNAVAVGARTGHRGCCCCCCCRSCCCCWCCDPVHISAVKHGPVHTGECHFEREMLHSDAVWHAWNRCGCFILFIYETKAALRLVLYIGSTSFLSLSIWFNTWMHSNHMVNSWCSAYLPHEEIA